MCSLKLESIGAQDDFAANLIAKGYESASGLNNIGFLWRINSGISNGQELLGLFYMRLFICNSSKKFLSSEEGLEFMNELVSRYANNDSEAEEFIENLIANIRSRIGDLSMDSNLNYMLESAINQLFEDLKQ